MNLKIKIKESKKSDKGPPRFRVLKGGYSPRLEEVDDKGPVLKKVKDKL